MKKVIISFINIIYKQGLKGYNYESTIYKTKYYLLIYFLYYIAGIVSLKLFARIMFNFLILI